MGRASVDIVLRSFFEFAIADLRKNQYLLADIWGVDLECDPLAKVEYAGIEYRNASSWFLNTDIAVLLQLRRDLPKLPAITIELVGSSEAKQQASIGDIGIEAMGDIEPEKIQKPATKVYKNFTPISYDPSTGKITLPGNLNTYQISPGLHVLVEKNTGKAFQIKKVTSASDFLISPEQRFDIKDVFIAPITDAWNAHYGRSRMDESYEIGVHANSQTIEAIWMCQLVEYILLKYKADYLEKRNISLSSFNASGLSQNTHYTADNVYSRHFTLNFQCETSWIDTIAPKISQVRGTIYIVDGPKSPAELLKQNPSWAMEADRKK